VKERLRNLVNVYDKRAQHIVYYMRNVFYSEKWIVAHAYRA
ncbi:hypothetical protein FOXB_02521, partial [Fusarium oxysporum f. sp. conglutinans Fo5176]